MARVTGESKNFSGTVGNIIFYQRNGVTYIRTKPTRYRDAKSESQLLARGRFTGCNRFYNLLEEGILRQVWKIAAKGTGKNPKNLFMQHSFYAFGKDQDITDYGRLQFSAGLLPMPDRLQVACYNHRDCLLQWEYDPLEAVGSPDDQLYIVELQTNMKPRIHETRICRCEGKAVFSLFNDICKYTHLYCFWGNKLETYFSSTHYFNEISSVEP